MSGAQTIVLGYTPDGVVLVPPNSPVTVQGGESVDIASFAGTYGPGGTAGNYGQPQGDARWAIAASLPTTYAPLAQALPAGGSDGQVVGHVAGSSAWVTVPVDPGEVA